MRAKEIEILQKTLDTVKTFRDDFDAQIDVTPLKREFELLVLTKIDQHLASYLVLNEYFSRFKHPILNLFNPSPPAIARSIIRAEGIKNARFANAATRALFAMAILISFYNWIKYHVLSWTMGLLAGEAIIMMLAGSMFRRWIAFQAFKELSAMYAEQAGSNSPSAPLT